MQSDDAHLAVRILVPHAGMSWLFGRVLPRGCQLALIRFISGQQIGTNVCISAIHTFTHSTVRALRARQAGPAGPHKGHCPRLRGVLMKGLLRAVVAAAAGGGH